MSTNREKQFIKQGLLRQKKGNIDAALKSFRRAIMINKNCEEAWYNLGNMYFHMNSYNESIEYFNNVIKLNSSHIDTLNKLGIIYAAQRNHHQAIKYYQQLLDITPENAAVNYNLAISLIELGDRLRARQHLEKAINLDPGIVDAHVLLGSVQTQLGEFELASKSYATAIRLNPDKLDAIGGLAFTNIKLHKGPQAYELIKYHIESGCDELSIVMSYALSTSAHNDVKGAVEKLEKVISINQRNQNKQVAQLHFIAGKLYDQLHDYANAFNHYFKGNNLIQTTYNKHGEKELFDRIKNYFSLSNTRNSTNTKLKGIKPVFVLGMPRSGTSLVEKIIGCHSSVYAAGEIADIQNMLHKFQTATATDMVYPEVVGLLDSKNISDMASSYLDKWDAISGHAAVVINKLPHNFLYIGFIRLLFPESKIIHCIRDPLDTCLSNYFQLFSGPLDYSYSLEDTANHYLHYRDLMVHWESIFPGSILQVKYEDLVSKQEQCSRQIIDYCGLDWQDACLHFYKSEFVTRTASNEQVRQPIYSNSVQRWRNYETQIQPLINLLNQRGMALT